MNKGKKLEKEVSNYLKSANYFFHKFTDSYSSRGIVSPVPSDFIIFPQFSGAILLECKETQKMRLPLSSFRSSQLKAMRKCCDIKFTNYYIIVKFSKGYIITSAKDIIEELDSGNGSIDLNKGYVIFKNVNTALKYTIEDQDR